MFKFEFGTELFNDDDKSYCIYADQELCRQLQEHYKDLPTNTPFYRACPVITDHIDESAYVCFVLISNQAKFAELNTLREKYPNIAFVAVDLTGCQTLNQLIEKSKEFIEVLIHLITKPGLINVDLDDIKSVFENRFIYWHSFQFSGETDKRLALAPLLPRLKQQLSGTSGVVVNIYGGFDCSLNEFYQVSDAIKEIISDDTILIVGTSFASDSEGKLSVSVIYATDKLNNKK